MKPTTWIAACALSLSAAFNAQAMSWPQHPVNFVVPYPAGGGVDPVARLIGQKLSERWGQPVVVQNKAGASGSIGAAHVARAKPDGLTIMMSATAEVVINQFIMPKMTYDPEQDLVPVTQVVRLPFLLVANPKESFSTLPELLAYARKNPGEITYASSGNGTPQHLSSVLLESLGNIQLTHIPYKGVAPSISALLAGEVSIGFVGLPTGQPHAQAGKLKALGLSSRTPSGAVPGVAPLAQTPGLEEFELNQWFGIFVPTGTENEIIDKIQKDVAEVLQLPDVRKILIDQGAEPSGMPTAEFQAFVKSERQKFHDIVKAGNL